MKAKSHSQSCFNTQPQIYALLQLAQSTSINCLHFSNYILNRCFGDEDDVKLNELRRVLRSLFKFEVEKTARPVCAKVFQDGDHGFVCLDCVIQHGAVFCIQCFNKSDHKGHNFKKEEVGQDATCDCGNEEVWKKQGFCSDHCSTQEAVVKVDQKVTQTFLKEMQYLFFLLTEIRATSNQLVKNKFSVIYPFALAQFLNEFNMESLISNQMTAMLLQSNLSKLIPSSFNYPYHTCSILEIILTFYEGDEQCHQIFDLMIALFTRPQFKKFLIINYMKFASTNCSLWGTKLIQINFQIYCSNKLINELIDSKQIMPLRICVESMPASWRFKHLAAVFHLYFMDLVQMSQLKFGVGKKYIKYSLDQGNVNDFSAYEEVAKKQQQSIEMYSIEQQYCRVLTMILKNQQIPKPTLLKSLKDVILYLKKSPTSISTSTATLTLSPFISKQRTLLILLFLYFDGHIEKGIDCQFLESVGLGYEVIFGILQSVLHVIRLYALNSSNVQTQERYISFYGNCLGNTTRILVSIDFLILKFCLLALNQLNPEIAQIKVSNIQQLSVKYEESIMFSHDEMPPQDLLALPTRFIEDLLKAELKDSAEGVYDRKKAVGMLVDYMGLLHEILLTNHDELYLKHSLELGSASEFTDFYGSLIKSMKNVKNDNFRNICDIFFINNKSSPFLKQFLSEYCEISDQRINLKKQKQHEFNGFNLSYLRSKKQCGPLQFYLEDNAKQFRFNSSPKQKESVPKLLTDLMFGPYLIKRVVEATSQYLQILVARPEIRKSDIGIFSELVEELIRLNYTLQNQEIHQVLLNISKNAEILSFLPEHTQREIGIYLDEDEKIKDKAEDEQAKRQKNQKVKSAKDKKLLKLKEKQNKAIEKIKVGMQSSQTEISQNHGKDDLICIFCRQSQGEEALQSLNQISRTTLFSQLYLETTRPVYKIVACGHYMHQSCFKKAYGVKERTIICCDWCKFVSNIQLNQLRSQQKVPNVETQINQHQAGQAKQVASTNHKKICQYVEQAQQTVCDVLKKLQNIKQNQNEAERLSTEQKLVESLASLILEGVFGNYQVFLRSLLSSATCIFDSLKNRLLSINNLTKIVWQQTSGEAKTKTTQMCRLAYKFTILQISSTLLPAEKCEFMSQQLKKLRTLLPIPLLNSLQFIIACLSSSNAKHLLSESKLTSDFAIQPQFQSLPDNLQELSKKSNGGECLNCGTKTNEIVMCLICGFISCIGCRSRRPTIHAISEHGWSAIFIRVDTGQPLYIYGLRNFQFQSIYKNYLGEEYIFDRMNTQKKKCDFSLDSHASEKISKDLLLMKIQQELIIGCLNKQKGSFIEFTP